MPGHYGGGKDAKGKKMKRGSGAKKLPAALKKIIDKKKKKDLNKPLTPEQLKKIQKGQKPASPFYDYFSEDNNNVV